MTDRYAVIGNPVAHSRSPAIHARFAAATGQDIEYIHLEAPRDGFAAAVDAFRRAGGKGLNVTLPFKGEAFRYAGEHTDRAREARAVNTLAFREQVLGDNTDGVGLLRDITVNLGVDLRGRGALLMGAGGAARGVVGALLGAGLASLTIANRTDEKARSLAAGRKGIAVRRYDELAGTSFDLVVNATSAGLEGDGPVLPAGVFARECLAYDMVYGRETAFLSAARAAGARTADGLGMLVEQAAESFLVWRGVRPDTGPVLREMRGRG